MKPENATIKHAKVSKAPFENIIGTLRSRVSVNTSLKNRLRIFLNHFAIITTRPVT